MSLTPWVSIDLDALRHNLAVVRQHAPKSRILAVIKANAYGHGRVAVQGLADADAFAVARIREALDLRKEGITKPLTVMGGVYSLEELDAAVRHELRVVVHRQEQLELMSGLAADRWPELMIKVDSGMHRLGFSPDQIDAVVAWLHARGYRSSPLLMTHMACADDRGNPMTDCQWQRFDPLVQRHGAYFSVANSAVIMSRPEMHGDWVRPGIMLYGASPFPDVDGPDLALRPVMTFASRLIAVKSCAAGETVGYGATWQCPEAMLLGVVAVGYGDGYPRHARNGTPVLVNGQRVPLAGRVSMDMITVDLRSQPDARPGDPVVLWGEGLPADEVARGADAIAYQLFCGITERVERRTLDHG